MSAEKKKRVLAISSSGGHWHQLLMLKDAFDGCDVFYATTVKEYELFVPNQNFHVVMDVSRWSKIKIPLALIKTLWLILKLKPDVVLSTGALPGLLAVFCGRLYGARTIWVDSFANYSELSMSGKIAGKFVSLWLTQWQHLETENGPFYKGSLI